MRIPDILPLHRFNEAARKNAIPVDEVRDFAPLVERLSRSRIVMLGESTHGTADFYAWRRLLSQWLIVKHGYQMIVVEEDWPSAYSIDRYVRFGEGNNARKVLEKLNRWPTWMWANTEVIRLAEWLRSHNAILPETGRAGFYGLDVYSLFESIHAVIEYLDRSEPRLADKARARYGCFDRFRSNELAYARSTLEFPEGCKEEVVQSLQDLLELRLKSGMRPRPENELFNAQQNARIVKNAENYYRAVVHGDDRSWNIRDEHMTETLELLANSGGKKRKIIVWAHNTHIGDYRFTDMKEQGLVNLGGLAKEKFGDDVFLVGFGTYEGEVIASDAWDGPIERMKVPPARRGSLESAYHEICKAMAKNVIFSCFDDKDREGVLAEPHYQRAIGVVYDPDHEKGNYVPTSLSRRYDAYVHVDRSSALEPLVLPFDRREFPETWPAGR